MFFFFFFFDDNHNKPFSSHLVVDTKIFQLLIYTSLSIGAKVVQSLILRDKDPFYFFFPCNYHFIEGRNIIFFSKDGSFSKEILDHFASIEMKWRILQIKSYCKDNNYIQYWNKHYETKQKTSWAETSQKGTLILWSRSTYLCKLIKISSIYSHLFY